VFKSVVKTVLKIAPYALAAAAVVFTGGAALGILPTFGAAVGGLVSSLGLSAAVTGALTGAVTSAGFGAALGFVTGGKKGLQKGALMGLSPAACFGRGQPWRRRLRHRQGSSASFPALPVSPHLPLVRRRR
jgi:hypothetical protein